MTQSVWRMKGAVPFSVIILKDYIPAGWVAYDRVAYPFWKNRALVIAGRMGPSSSLSNSIDICSLMLSERRHVVGWSALAGLMDPVVVPLWRKKRKTLKDRNFQSFNCCGRAGTECSSTRWRVDEFVSSPYRFFFPHWISEQTWK